MSVAYHLLSPSSVVLGGSINLGLSSAALTPLSCHEPGGLQRALLLSMFPHLTPWDYRGGSPSPSSALRPLLLVAVPVAGYGLTLVYPEGIPTISQPSNCNRG